jgi:hypothetical protein
VTLAADDQRVGLAIERGHIKTVPGTFCAKHPQGRSGKRFQEPSRTPSVELQLGQAGLLRLVLGLNTIDEVARGGAAGLRPPERTLLRVLFPIQPTASGPWG